MPRAALALRRGCGLFLDGELQLDILWAKFCQAIVSLQ
jgi:hypothetical protein